MKRSDVDAYSYATKCVHGRCYEQATHFTRPPLVFSNINTSGADYFYSRYQNYNAEVLESHLASLYEVDPELVTVTSSGMSAFARVLDEAIDSSRSYLGCKPHIILAKDAFEELKQCARLYKDILELELVDLHDLSILKSRLKANTILIVLEGMSNPLYKTYDIPAICNLAKTIHNCRVAVDNSMLTSYYYNPFKDGADIVFESLSKYTCGSGDVLGGVVLGVKRNNFSTMRGETLPPFSAWLLQRGITTLPLRLDKISTNAGKVVQVLQKFTPHVLWGGKTGMITLSFGSEDLNRSFLTSLKLLTHTDSYGYEESLISMNWGGFNTKFDPPYDTHLRISIGLEDVGDIIRDLTQAYTSMNSNAQNNSPSLASPEAL